jgi:hypothetical protein
MEGSKRARNQLEMKGPGVVRPYSPAFKGVSTFAVKLNAEGAAKWRKRRSYRRPYAATPRIAKQLRNAGARQ